MTLFELIGESLKEMTDGDAALQPLLLQVVGDEKIAHSLNNFAVAYVGQNGELDVKFLLATLAVGIAVGRKYPETVQ